MIPSRRIELVGFEGAPGLEADVNRYFEAGLAITTQAAYDGTMRRFMTFIRGAGEHSWYWDNS